MAPHLARARYEEPFGFFPTEQRCNPPLFFVDYRVLEEPSTFLILCCTIFLTSARATVR